MLLIKEIIIMSTYCPKTLRGWKIQKRSLNDLHQAYQQQSRINTSKSYIIHAFQSTQRHYNIPSEPVKKQRYRMDDSRTKSMRLSNGFRKVRKTEIPTSFSKIIFDDKLIKINNFIQDYQEKSKAGSSIERILPKARQRHKKIRVMRGQIKKRPGQNSILNKLLLIKNPINYNHRQTLFTDNQHPPLSQLQNDEFSPYRSKRHLTEQTQQNIIIPIAICRKQEQPTCQNINFLSISQINLKHKQKQHKPKFNLKRRSFSVKQLKDSTYFGKTMLKKANHGVQIQPWQIS